MNSTKAKHQQRLRRKNRSRARVIGTAERPRLCVTRSLHFLSAQLIDDGTGRTLVSASTKTLGVKGTKTEQATALGKSVAEAVLQKGMKSVVFDRSGRKYHGRIRAFAESAREHGLVF